MTNNIKFTSLGIILICIIVFILQLLIPGFTETFMLTQNALIKPWQFLTAVFLHGSLAHLAYNMFAVLIFGIMLENIIGSKKFISLWIISGILANIISFTIYPNSLGASGAIMALIGTITILRPMMTVWAFGMIMPMFILAIIWVIGSFMGMFGFGDQSIGYLAHLSGIMIGLIYGLYLRLSTKNKTGTGFIKKQRIELPEDYMQVWENRYIKS